MDRIIGPQLHKNEPPKKKVIVSAPKDDAKHPRKMVLNAFLGEVPCLYAGTQGQGKLYRYYRGMARGGMKTAAAFDFFDKVKAYD